MRRLRPYLLLTAFIMIFFRKAFFLGLIPIPFDLLVQWFFPYNSGGWYIPGHLTVYKGGHFASDAIREMYPWKQLAVELMKNGDVPLWNPYAFSGTPLLANMQTAAFYPLNVIFFLIQSFPWAWSAYIISAPLFAGLFMLKFLRALKLDRPSALIGAIAFSASGYMTAWLEWGVGTHQLVWLPLSLYAVKRWWDLRKRGYLALFIFSVAATIFAGYPQGAAYNLIIVFTWILYLAKGTAKALRAAATGPLIIASAFAIGLTAVQWLPTAELYFHSAMRGEVSQSLSREGALPLAQLATLIAPDYFGNRVSDDYWAKESFSGVDYMDADLYLGVTTLLLALVAVLDRKRRRETRWLIAVLLMGLLLGTKTPVSSAISRLGIPVISTGAAAEALLMLVFAVSCLGAFGMESICRGVQNLQIRRASLFLTGVVALLLFAAFFLDGERSRIARNSLIIPGAAFLIAASTLEFVSRRKKSMTSVRMLTILVAVELVIHADKLLPFSSPAFAFPKHELIEELRMRAGHDRVTGFWDSEIATNFDTAFRLYSAEGYDPLYIRRYGELVAAAGEGKLPQIVPRSDADITMGNETNRNRLIDLASIKFIPAKVTVPTQIWEEEPLKYDPARFKLVWQKDRFKIYENLKALPRAKLFYEWEVIRDDAGILARLYDPQFDPYQSVIIEKEPMIERVVGVSPRQSSSAAEPSNRTSITRYEPNLVQIQNESPVPAILLLTDSFYPGWKVTIDGVVSELMRANYSFRAIAVPPGKHDIIFRYVPKTFLISVLISSISLAFLEVMSLLGYPRKRSSRL